MKRIYDKDELKTKDERESFLDKFVNDDNRYLDINHETINNDKK